MRTLTQGYLDKQQNYKNVLEDRVTHSHMDEVTDVNLALLLRQKDFLWVRISRVIIQDLGLRHRYAKHNKRLRKLSSPSQRPYQEFPSESLLVCQRIA